MKDLIKQAAIRECKRQLEEYPFDGKIDKIRAEQEIFEDIYEAYQKAVHEAIDQVQEGVRSDLRAGWEDRKDLERTLRAEDLRIKAGIRREIQRQ